VLKFSKELKNSTSALESLEINLPTPSARREAWGLASKFHKLIHFILPNDINRISSLSPENICRMNRQFRLGSVEREKEQILLQINDFQIDRASMEGFFHTVPVEEVNFRINSLAGTCEGPGFISSGAFKSLVLGCGDSLKTLYISGLSTGGDIPTEVDSQISSASFPNLENFHIENIEPKLLTFFSSIECLNLRDVSISGSFYPQESFNWLCTFLKTYGFKLTHLSVAFGNSWGRTGAPIEFATEIPSFASDNLEAFTIGSKWGKQCPLFFSKFNYPNLVKLAGVQGEI